MLCGRIEYDCRKKGKWPLLRVTDRPSLLPAAPAVPREVCASEGRSSTAQRQRQEEAPISCEVEISHDSKNIEKRLEQTLIHDEAMPYGLYKYELEEILDELRSSLAHDNDDYIFAVTENSGHVAMVLIEKSGQSYINEQAREKLKALWPAAYESNMKQLIPVFAQQLHEGQLPINGVKQRGVWRRRSHWTC